MASPKAVAEISNLAKVLINDYCLLQKWSEFSGSLGCPAIEKYNWEIVIRSGTANFHDIFSKMLSSWISRFPDRTVNDLCQILMEMENIAVAEQLEDDFGKNDLICFPVNNHVDQAGPSSSYRNISNSLNGEVPRLAKIPRWADDHRERTVALPRSSFEESGQKITWPISHGLLNTANNFSGRETDLNELNSHFSSKKELVLVCGFGGIGKTELCRKFTNDIRPQLNDSQIISRVWLHGDSIETLRDSILALADKLGVKNESNPSPPEYFNFLASKILDKCSRLLVVVDNVDTAFEEVTKVITSVRTHQGLFLIVTSRNSSILDSAGITLKLNVLRDDQARSMLQQSIENLANSDADLLCKLLQNYPLALQQAVAYIRQQQRDYRTPKYSVSDYILEFERKKSAMFEQNLSKFEHDYELTTSVVWDMTLEKMSEDGLEIMKILAYLDPDKILIDFLQNVVMKINPTNNFEESLNIIHNYSLVKVEHKFLSIHRLVQEVIRLKKVCDLEYPKSLFENAFLAWVNGKKHKFILGVSNHDRQQLNTICKFAFDCEAEKYDDFEALVQFLFNVDRVDCVVEYTKLCFEKIEFSSSLNDQGKIDLIEKVLLYIMIQGHGCSRYVSNENVEKGDFDVYLPDYCDLTSLERILKLVQKFFSSNVGMSYEISKETTKVLRRADLSKRERCIPLCQQILESTHDTLYEDAFKALIRLKIICPLSGQKEILEKLLESKRSKLGESHSNTLKVTEMIADLLGG